MIRVTRAGGAEILVNPAHIARVEPEGESLALSAPRCVVHLVGAAVPAAATVTLEQSGVEVLRRIEAERTSNVGAIATGLVAVLDAGPVVSTRGR